MIRCITFDLDDTLWAVAPVIRQANQTLFDWLARYAPAFTALYRPDDLAALRHIVLQQQPEIAHSVSQIRLAQLRYGLAQAGYGAVDAENLTRQAFEVFLEARQQVTFFAHARETLTLLRQQGYRLGALSNGNADVQRVGLGDLMDFQFKAEQVGEMKPHPLMFETMLRHTGLRPEQVVHVGDHPEHDIAGASQAGLWTVRVDLTACLSDRAPPVPDEIVSCLSQLPSAIASITKKAALKATL